MSSQPSIINTREMWRITRCLTVTCLLAALILGLVYAVTEPITRVQRATREAAVVRQLLDLGAEAAVTEIRRYLWRSGDSMVGYLTERELFRVTVEGAVIDRTPRSETLASVTGDQLDAWVVEHFPGAESVGRFFIGHGLEGAIAGYVTEEVQQGFKSPIRFFVALTADFTVRAVEVVAHEEDPGLGAEIVRPGFKHQFAGRSREGVAALRVVKDPIPPEWLTVVRARDGVAFDVWRTQHAAALAADGDRPIYAVTGATISSRALTDGVKRAVAHLQHRLSILERAGEE
ncbi:MAG: FMN-binding protein [Deltaproteobacteria bacterium]|nr:FMN-binding protein [Deltaproteobacteria bacterium]